MAKHERKRMPGANAPEPVAKAVKQAKRQKLESKFSTQWSDEDLRFSLEHCFAHFLLEQQERGNSKATIDFYKRFYKKLLLYPVVGKPMEEYGRVPVKILEIPGFQLGFMESLGEVSIQTVNSYLRGLRAFGNFCAEEGYIDDFDCPIKEVEPPVKQVYTDKELAKLMKKPKITEFADFRMYCIIGLILNTGARSNTIINIRICDVELEEGFITFIKLKNHGVVRLALERKVRQDLREWIEYWRYGKGAIETDYLFCNAYGEQMTRSTLSRAITEYNHSRGVEKTSIHLLRHTFAKKWITSGGDIITLARVLTHSELEMVKRYANLYGTDVKNEIEEHSAIAQMKKASGQTLKTQGKKKRLK